MPIRRLSQDALKHCLEIISRFDELAKYKRDYGEKFRTRCRTLPQLMEDVGIVATLAFAYAKASDKVRVPVEIAKKLGKEVREYRQGCVECSICDIIAGYLDGKITIEEVKSVLQGKFDEAVGYAAFLYATVQWLAQHCPVPRMGTLTVENLLEKISELSTTELALVMYFLRPMYNVLKELTDAKYGG